MQNHNEAHFKSRKVQKLHEPKTRSCRCQNQRAECCICLITQSKKNEAEIKDTFQSESDLTKSEIRRYSLERMHDVDTFLDDYVRAQIKASQQLANGWAFAK